MNPHQIAQLLSADAYPEPTSKVFMQQTHISLLFFTDKHVYKVKKPVNLGFLDFSTLEKRHFYCLEELRLNRRLAPDIYLDLVELREDEAGCLRINGPGRVVEYAVKMVRLPEDRIMARLLEKNAVTPAQIEQLAALVARFHKEADTDERIAAFGSPEAIRENWEENLRQTRVFIGRTITEKDHSLIAGWVNSTLEREQELFKARVRDGFIRDCDGDLHTENICLNSSIHIFDCIEFNERFRFSDTAADVAFLAMDLENHGRRDLAELFVDCYQQHSGDKGLRAVLPLYLANRAFIRGKVESLRLDDPLFSDDEKVAAAAHARRFFRLARGYLLRRKLPPTLFMTCGPSGCGKSALASELAFQLGMDHVSSDIERKRLAGISSTERGADIYGTQWNRATYARLAELAAAALHAGKSIVVDATFIRRADREQFCRLAKAASASCVILYPECPDELVRQRIEARCRKGNSVSDGTVAVYLRQKAAFEPPTADEGMILLLDATHTPFDLVDQVLAAPGVLEKIKTEDFFLAD